MIFGLILYIYCTIVFQILIIIKNTDLTITSTCTVYNRIFQNKIKNEYEVDIDR